MSTPSAAAAGVSTHDRQPREVRREPFVVLADIAHDRALVTWGAFFFIRSHPDHRWAIVEDHLLPDLVDRRPCIGATAESFGAATVEVLDRSGAVVAEAATEQTWVWVDGLRPDTEYHYRVSVGVSRGGRGSWGTPCRTHAAATTSCLEADLLNAVLAEKAAEYGFQFVDVRSRFVDHGVNAPEPWILGLTDPGLFNPNLSGYRAHTAAVTSSLNGGTSAS